MHARDVMVAPVTMVTPSTTVKEVAELFPEERIGAAPVIDSQERLVGIISEGSLVHRVGIYRKRHARGRICQITGPQRFRCHDPHGHHSLPPLHEIATLMEKNAIKRVPILENGQLVSIISRANLIQAVATAPTI